MGSYFTEKYEHSSSNEGIQLDLETPAGTVVLWYRWNPTSPTDDVYDIGQGRDWHDPFELHVIAASRFEGGETNMDLGAYSTDTLHLTVRADEADTKLPGLEHPQTNEYLKDRVVYDGTVFTVERVAAHGHFHDWEAVFGIDLSEVDPDMLVNDPDFAQYAS